MEIKIALSVFAMLPSFVWLRFYHARDEHPEPRRLLWLTFMGGALTVLLAIAGYELLDMLMFHLSGSSGALRKLVDILGMGFFGILGLAAFEEILKYLPVRMFAIKNRAMDEPIDMIEYMVTSALGFAAAENVFYVMGEFAFLDMNAAIALNVLRMFTAVLIHALASGIFGYVLATALLKKKTFGWWWPAGLIAAALLHAAFNYFIISIRDIVLVLILLLFASFFLLEAMQYLKNLNINYIINEKK